MIQQEAVVWWLQSLGTLHNQGDAKKGLHRLGCVVCLPEQKVAEGSLSVGFMSCHKKKEEGSKRCRGCGQREKQHRKGRVNLLAFADYPAPLVISAGYRGCQSKLEGQV